MLKPVVRILSFALVCALPVGASAGCVIGTLAFGPSIEAPAIVVPTDDASLARGRYVAHHVSACMTCHSKRDYRYFTAPLVEGTEGKGGEAFDASTGFPGAVYAKNITPTALSSWTDGDVFRAIASGVSRDGTALFPLMPYPHYSKMAKSDVLAVVQYLRTLPPLDGTTPERQLDVPLNIIVNTIPREHEGPASPPSLGDPAYGAYLVEMAACGSCHSQEKRGTPVEGLEWAGGREFIVPGFGTVRSSNITPHDVTGLGGWTRDFFITRFKAMTADNVRQAPLEKGAFQTVMPWTDYAGLTDEDLGAIYDFLRTVTPVDQTWEKFSPEGSVTP